MAKPSKNSSDEEQLVKMAKDAEQMAKDMGIKTANIHAVKITIETGEGEKIVIDPMRCSASVMVGMEEYGITFQITGKVKEGVLKFE